VDFTAARHDGMVGASAGPHANHLYLITTPVRHHLVFTGRKLFLPPNQQHQSTEGKINIRIILNLHPLTYIDLRQKSPSKNLKKVQYPLVSIAAIAYTMLGCGAHLFLWS